MNDGRFWLRSAGAVVIVLVLAVYDSTATSVWQSLVLPLLLALAALALVQNPAAVAFGTAVLALIHTDFASAYWVERIAYPLLALASGTMLAIIFGQRFRQRILATRQARWANRDGSAPPAADRSE